MAGIRRITNDKLVRPGQRVGVTTYIELVLVAVAHEGVRQPITGSKRCPPPFGDVEGQQRELRRQCAGYFHAPAQPLHQVSQAKNVR